MVKYDKNGRPIKDSKSIFDSFSKPKKRNYKYTIEKKDDSDKEIYNLDEDIIENSIKTEETKDEGVSLEQEELDLTQFPIWLIYFLVWFIGFIMIIIGFFFISHIKKNNVLGGKKVIRHIYIATSVYLIYFVVSSMVITNTSITFS
ncbi:MAG: hypothetical protein VXZ40_00540 [Nanoarchaeota archaeon]|nr:hypothetical protein [Nanoarchaeota archaeon]